MEIRKIPNQIIKGKLTPLTLSKVTGIALHHMAHPTWDVKQVESYHVNTNGWIAIGYNYWIAFDGTIYEGRGLNVGAHVSGKNSSLIGIGFQGNFQSGSGVALSVMPDAQFNAGVQLIKYLQKQIPSIKKVGGHKDFAASSCPGNQFPLEEMLALKEREEKEMSYDKFKEYMAKYQKEQTEKTVSDYAKEPWGKAVKAGIFDGTKPRSELTRQDAAKVFIDLGLIK